MVVTTTVSAGIAVGVAPRCGRALRAQHHTLQTEDEETALKARIREAFSVFDREGRNAVDVREVRDSI